MSEEVACTTATPMAYLFRSLHVQVLEINVPRSAGSQNVTRRNGSVTRTQTRANHRWILLDESLKALELEGRVTKFKTGINRIQPSAPYIVFLIDQGMPRIEPSCTPHIHHAPSDARHCMSVEVRCMGHNHLLYNCKHISHE